MEWWLNHVGQMAQSVQDYSSDEQVIAVYSSEQLAQKAIERFKTQPRFIGHEEDFYISKYIINHEEWKDGYFCSDDLKGDM